MINKEIERKFLVDTELLPSLQRSSLLTQGYLSFEPEIRIRTKESDNRKHAKLAFKRGRGIERDEIELDVATEQAGQLLEVCQGLVIAKTRYEWFDVDGTLWEIDQYHRDFEGLWVAEAELPTKGHPLSIPRFVLREVTDDDRFKNRRLAEDAPSVISLLETAPA